MAEKNKYNKAYDKGYNEGKDAGGLDQWSHNIVKDASISETNDSYNKGYEDGVNDKYDDSNSNYSGGTSESSGK